MVNLPLPVDVGAGQRDAGVREAAPREAAHADAGVREAAHREAAQREAAQREAAHREAGPREARAREAPAPLARAPVTTPAPVDAELQLARLEGRVAALEAALERRSSELMALQQLLCHRDLTHWARLLAGLPPLPQVAFEPGFWQETRELAMAEVPETLAALWSSLYPPQLPRTSPSPSPPALPSPIPQTVR